MIDVDGLRARYRQAAKFLDERGRRLFAANEALALGYGGVSAASAATGLARSTIRRAIVELQGGVNPIGSRVRRPGGGRKRAVVLQPDLPAALEALIEDAIRGDPETPLRWISRSQRQIARALLGRGFRVSQKLVGLLLRELGYSCQANRKTREGTSHPDRDAQFAHIDTTVRKAIAAGVFRPQILTSRDMTTVLFFGPVLTDHGSFVSTRPGAHTDAMTPPALFKRCRMASQHGPRKPVHLHRFGERRPLTEIKSHVAHDAEVGRRVETLGGGSRADPLGDAEHLAAYRALVAVDRTAADEARTDLKFGNRKIADVDPGRFRHHVVDRDGDVAAFELPGRLLHQGGVAASVDAADLHGQLARRCVRGQPETQAVDECGISKIATGKGTTSSTGERRSVK